MNSQGLKPCPTCGKTTAVLTKYGSCNYIVVCENPECADNAVGRYTQEEAVIHWNTRPIEDELRARIERLEAACRWLAKHCSTFDFIINEFDPMHKTYSIQQYLEWAETAEEETHAPR